MSGFESEATLSANKHQEKDLPQSVLSEMCQRRSQINRIHLLGSQLLHCEYAAIIFRGHHRTGIARLLVHNKHVEYLQTRN